MKTITITIGRETDNQIVLNDHTDVTSRHHAVLMIMPNGKMTITDQSANGTYINGQRISPNVPVPVTRKDTISFAHQCTLDWDRVPKLGQWLTYLLVGLAVAAVAALAIIFGPKLINKEEENGENKQEEVVTNECAITFDANGGEGSMGPQKVLKGASAGIIANTFTREHFIFKGWNTQADGNGTAYEDKASVTLSEDNVTLYAQWEEKTFTVKFIQNDSKVGGEMKPLVVKEGKETTLPANAFTRKGFEFKGWNTKSNGKGDSYSDKAVIILTADLTLYAQWNPITKGKPNEKKLNEKESKEEKPKEEKPVL